MKTTDHNQRQPPAADEQALDGFALDAPGDEWLERLRLAAHDEPIAIAGAYELIEEIGRGGQGAVYRARRSADGATVAVKVAHADAPGDAKDIASRLDHPAIVPTLDTFLWQGRSCQALPYIEGENIASYCDARANAPKGPIEIASLFATIAEALHHAHQQGVIHRDIKPSNVLVRADAAPAILDFGSARTHHEGAHDTERTTADRLALTPAYASPEQAQGDESPDIRTDIYSLGVLLYRCVTGEMPYTIARGNALRTLDTIRTCPALPPRHHNGLISREFDAVIRRALEKAPADRYQSMEAFAADLRALAEGRETSAGVPTFVTALRRTARDHTAASVLLAALIGAILLGSALSIGFAWEAHHAALRETDARRASEELNRVLQESLGAAVASRSGQSALLLDSLDDIARRADEELAAYPEHAADLLLTVGETYRSLWRYELSVPPLRRAQELYESLHDPPELKVARTLSVLGTALTAMRDDEAVGVQERALAIRRRHLGERHPDTLESMVKLAYALHQAKDPPDFDRAHDLMTTALDTYRAIYPEPHRETGSCIHNLAYLTLRMRQYEEGKALYREAIEEFRAANATDDPYYAEVLHTYSSLLTSPETAEECLALLDEAIPLVQRIYGEERVRPLIERRVRALLQLDRIADAGVSHREAIALLLDACAAEGLIDETRAASITALVRIEPATSIEGATKLIELAETFEGNDRATLYRAAHTSARIVLATGHADLAQAIAQRMIDGADGRPGAAFGEDLLKRVTGTDRRETAPR